MAKVPIPPHIEDLEPYIAGKPIEELAREKNLTRIVKLASNENPMGSSPKALAAVREHLGLSFRYVDPASFELTAAIAKKFSKRPSQIICGSGIDALLSYMVKAFTEDGDEVLTSHGTFIGIYVNTNKHHRTLVQAPMKNFHYDLEAILAAISHRTRIIYLANPNNPTGTIFTAREFERFMAQVPNNIVVILDEAYVTYAEDNPDYPRGMSYEYDNLLVTRTFSKDYGLAGLRIGFAVGPEYLIKELYKVKLPFEPNFLAQKAAVAALDDDEFIRQTARLNERNLKRMRAKFAELGIRQIPSEANFVLLILPTEETAKEFNLACLDRGLIVRHVRAFGIPTGIRINTGTDEETTFALDVIEQVWAQIIKDSPNHIVVENSQG